MLLLVKSEMLRLFVNNLTADDKSSRHNRENSKQQIQMILSQKQKFFSVLYIEFLNSTSNFECFEKNVEYHSLIIFKIVNSERCQQNVRFMAILWQSTFYSVPNTAEISTVQLLYYSPINLRKIELRKVALSRI